MFLDAALRRVALAFLWLYGLLLGPFFLPVAAGLNRLARAMRGWFLNALISFTPSI